MKARPSRQTVISPCVGPPGAIGPRATVARWASPSGGLADPVGGQGAALGVVDRRLEAGEAPDVDGLGERVLRALAGADPSAVGLGGVHRRLQRELEQRVPVKAGGERLADAADRLAHAGALLLELGEAALELARHVVELLAEQGELVAAATSAPSEEKSPPARRRAASRKRPSWPCRAREASSEKKKARMRKPAMKIPASRRSALTEPPVAWALDRIETATWALSKPVKVSVTTW